MKLLQQLIGVKSQRVEEAQQNLAASVRKIRGNGERRERLQQAFDDLKSALSRDGPFGGSAEH